MFHDSDIVANDTAFKSCLLFFLKHFVIKNSLFNTDWMSQWSEWALKFQKLEDIIALIRSCKRKRLLSSHKWHLDLKINEAGSCFFLPKIISISNHLVCISIQRVVLLIWNDVFWKVKKWENIALIFIMQVPAI